VWAVEVDGTAVATPTLYWSDILWPDDGRAGYLHRFATRRAGTGLGAVRWSDHRPTISRYELALP
jgi:hypothetical protein